MNWRFGVLSCVCTLSLSLSLSLSWFPPSPLFPSRSKSAAPFLLPNTQRALSRKRRELEMRGAGGGGGGLLLDGHGSPGEGSSGSSFLDPLPHEGLSMEGFGGVGGRKPAGKKGPVQRKRRGDASLINPTQRKLPKKGPLGPPRPREKKK